MKKHNAQCGGFQDLEKGHDWIGQEQHQIIASKRIRLNTIDLCLLWIETIVSFKIEYLSDEMNHMKKNYRKLKYKPIVAQLNALNVGSARGVCERIRKKP